MIIAGKEISDKYLEGMSGDGFITDQDMFTEFPYRTVTTDYNGCGWIAAYNLRHALEPGFDDIESVRAEMDGMHSFRFPGPTLMRVMREYLRRHVPEWKETTGRTAAVDAACRSFAGIFRYNEGHVPHFISFVRQPDGLYRFFNVDDSLNGGDFTESMESFASKHFLRGNVIVLTVPEK